MSGRGRGYPGRALLAGLAGIVTSLGGCAPTLRAIDGPLVELALDEGKPLDKPTTPGTQLETLVHFDPRLPTYALRRMRFLLGQHGHLVFSFYRVRADGMPGELVAQVDRSYGPELVTGVESGELRWVQESLAHVPLHSGAFLVGIAAPDRGSDPRLWATRNDSGAVWERELDGTLGHVRRTPVLRIEVDPAPL